MLSEDVESILILRSIYKKTKLHVQKGQVSIFLQVKFVMILSQYIATVWQTMSVSQVTQPVVNMETECREFDRITTLTQKENSPLT